MPQVVLFSMFICWSFYKLCMPWKHLYKSLLQTNNEDESKCRYFVASLKNKTEVKFKTSTWLLEVKLSVSRGSIPNALCVQMCKHMHLLVKLY